MSVIGIVASPSRKGAANQYVLCSLGSPLSSVARHAHPCCPVIVSSRTQRDAPARIHRRGCCRSPPGILKRDGKSGSAVKTGEEWKATGVGLDASKAAALASALRSLRVEDIAREAQAVTTPATTLIAGVGPKSFTVRVLGLRPGGFGERYARADGIALPPGYVLVLSKSTAQSLLP